MRVDYEDLALSANNQIEIPAAVNGNGWVDDQIEIPAVVNDDGWMTIRLKSLRSMTMDG